MPRFSSYVEVLRRATSPWLLGPPNTGWGRKWVNVLGGQTNLLRDWAKDGVVQRFPRECFDDTLVPLGTERGIDRGQGESAASYRPRVWNAWETWRWSGTTFGILKGSESAGWSIETFDPDLVWPLNWMDDGHVWVINAQEWKAPDGTHRFWNRFWVVLDYYAERGTAFAKIRGSAITRGTTIRNAYATLTLEEASTLKRMINKWKGSHSTCPRMYLILSIRGWEDIRGPFTFRGTTRYRGGIVVPITVGEE